LSSKVKKTEDLKTEEAREDSLMFLLSIQRSIFPRRSLALHSQRIFRRKVPAFSRRLALNAMGYTRA
jgi:hypothetical protein